MTDKRITLGILAHVDAGKTTLSEAMLYRTGELRKPGRVDHGDTFLDDSEIERNRGITVFSRQARLTIPGVRNQLSGNRVTDYEHETSGITETRDAGKDTLVTLIDTPGHVDFAAEMERALSVIDYALLVVSGSEGVQAHTRTLYRMLSDRGIPVFVFINKMDIAVRSREDILSDLAAELGCGAVDFTGITECLSAVGTRHGQRGSNGDLIATDHAGHHMLTAKAAEEFIDAVTLYSSELAELVIEHELEAWDAGAPDAGEDGNGSGWDNANAAAWIPDDSSIAMSIKRGEIVPCIFGSALKIEGVDEMLEVIGRFTTEPEYGKDFGAKVYKVSNAEDGSRMTFIKLTGGVLHVRDTVNQNKINQIRLYSGSKYVTTDEAPAGTVCAVTGLTDVLPGDALGNEKPEKEAVIRPFMVYTVGCPEDRDPYLVMKDLEKLAQEDPALSVRWLAETGEIEMRLMGQVQLEVITTLVRDRFGYDIAFGSGKVMYLETIDGVFEGVGHFEPLRHYAEVHIIAEPGERGSGVVIRSIVPEDELARNWQRLILTHIDEKEHAGVLTGAPITDVRLTLAAGRAHDKHTNGGDFREATYRAIRNALMQAREAGQAVLLEPWYEYEIELPAQTVGRAMTDIRQMGGSQDELEQNGDTARIRGKVPASEIACYQQILTSYTSGLGRLSCTHAGYFACHNTEEVIEECGYDPERDIDNPADSVFVNHGGSDIVKWDEVTQHMHLGSALPKYLRQTGYPGSGSEYGIDGQDGVHGYGGRAHNDFGGRADYGFGSNDTGYGSGADRRSGGQDNAGILTAEERKRQLAAENELRMIFERTYGPVRSRTGREATERSYNGNADAGNSGSYRKDAPGRISRGGSNPGSGSYSDQKSPEQQAADELHNQQIRARHERKKTDSSADESIVILIDGYNLIHADEYLRDLSVRDMGAARDQILERLCNYAAYTGSEVVIVFDAYKVAGGEGHEEDYMGVRVVFTAQDEPADIRIGLLTNSMKGRRMYVVSSDMLVQQDSFEHGALRISSREFMRLLGQSEEEIRRALVE